MESEPSRCAPPVEFLDDFHLVEGQLIEARLPIPTPVAFTSGLIELWHDDTCVAGWLSVELVERTSGTEYALPHGRPGWWICGEHRPTAEACVAALRAVYEREGMR